MPVGPELRVLDISRCIGRRGALGVPPPLVINDGIAALSPNTLRLSGWHLGQALVVRRKSDEDLSEQLAGLKIDGGHQSGEERVAVAMAWPLNTVPDDAVALDLSSMRSLQLDVGQVAAETLRPRGQGKARRVSEGSQSKSRSGSSSRRKKKSRPRSSLQSLESRISAAPEARVLFADRQSERHVENSLSVCVDAINEACVLDAGHVSLIVSDRRMADIAGSDAYNPRIRASLRGRILAVGMVTIISVLGEDVEMRVGRLLTSGQILDKYGCVTDTTEISISTLTENRSISRMRENTRSLPTLAEVGGLEKEARLITHLLDIAFRKNIDSSTARPHGVLLYGPTGTGKTMLAEAIAGESKANVEIVKGPEIISSYLGESEAALSAVFAKAASRLPCIIILDSVDTVALRRDSATATNAEQRLTATLLTLMDGSASEGAGLFVIGTTSRLELLDPAMRRHGRFDHEVEIAPPSSQARFEILRCIISKAADQNLVELGDSELRTIANNAYGFVGADLVALWREAVLLAIARDGEDQCQVVEADMRQSMSLIRPSALREVAVEIPSVKWEDIGGKEDVKKRIKEAVEWPLSSEGAEMFASIGIRPPRGILLFGPPGCSKTLLAKAVATESGANFISIKGPELLSKYVGESEKAVRTTFQRARAASPCVIFFDEIDALATSRSSPNATSAESRVLAQLLTELDGIDSPSLSDAENHVVVIAATNRPDLLDSALLRPGRMDRLLYVGLPDREERLKILSVCCHKLPLGADVVLEEISGWPQVCGMSGAEIAALVREAGLAAMEEDIEHAQHVNLKHFEIAKEKVRKGTTSEMLAFYKGYMDNVKGVLLDRSDWKGEPVVGAF